MKRTTRPPIDQMFAWALEWTQHPDRPVGPLEVAKGEYTAVNARGPFLQAVFLRCPVAFGDLLSRLRELSSPDGHAPSREHTAHYRQQHDIVRAWAAPFGLGEERWFTGMVAFRAGVLLKTFGGKFQRSDGSTIPADEWFARHGTRPPRLDPAGVVKWLDEGTIYKNLEFRSSEPKEDPEFFAFWFLQYLLGPVGANPYSESLDEFVDRSRDHYHARASLLIALGAQSTGSRRAKGKPQLAEHCTWLALHAVEGLSISDVARRVHSHRTTVSKAVHALGSILGVSVKS